MYLFGFLVIIVVVGILAYLYKERELAQAAETAVAPTDMSGSTETSTGDDVETSPCGVSTADSGNQEKEEVKPIISNMENNVMEEKKGTRDLFLETLTKIGCQYDIDEGEDGDINFGYQGEFFVVRASNSNCFIHIYDTHWAHVELYDIDEFARLKKAINESNIKNSVTTVYTIDEAGSNVDVHCKSVILFTPEIPDITDYLRLELREYFRVHETINLEMAKQREQESGK